MSKRMLNLPTFLVALMLMYQLVLPFSSAFAAESNSVLLPPSNLTYQELTPDDIKLTWSAVVGATGYNVYEIKEGQLLLVGTSKTNSFTFNNLAEGSYSYVVTTLLNDEESGPNAPVTFNISYPDMTAPTSLTYVMKNGNDITLNWTAAPYVEKYNVYEVNTDGEKTLVTSTSARTYTITNAVEGKYHYEITAFHSLYGESPFSQGVQVDVVHPVMVNPLNLSYNITNGNDIELKWQSVSYATGYNVYQLIDGEKKSINKVTSTNFKLTNQPAGDYSYQVYSVSDRFGESLEGSAITFTIQDIKLETPNVTVETSNINDVTVKWDAVPYATGYYVYEVVNGEKILKGTVTSTSVKYTNQSGGSYTFIVKAYSSRFGESEDSASVTVNVETVVMEKPNNLNYKIQNGNDVTLSWDPVTNATNYKVYQIIGGQKVFKTAVTGTSVAYTNSAEGDYVYEVHSNSTRFGESDEGSKLEFALAHPEMVAPPNVTNEINNPTQFTLSWGAVEYATQYRVYEIVNGQKKLLRNLAGTQTTYTSMMAGTYTYEIYSYSPRFGESAEGTKIEVTLNGESLATPTNFTYSLANINDIRLQWDSVQYAKEYKLYQIVDGEKILKKTQSGTFFTLANMPEGDYTFEVYAYSSLLGESPEGSQVQVSIVHPEMESPEDVTYKVQNGNDVVLSWGTATYATSYKVYELINGEEVLKSTVTTKSVTYANQPEGDHSYIIRSVSNRFGESVDGTELKLTLVHPKMEAPIGLTQTVLLGNDIKLSWNASSYATGYNVYQITEEGKVLLRNLPNATTTTFVNMPEGNYQYEVHSYSNRFGESEESSEISLDLVHPTMQAPENLVKSIVNGNDIKLQWSASSYASGYKIYQVVDGEKILKTTVTGTFYTFVNMPEGDYHYEVKSFSSRFGESAEGSDLSFELIHPIMQAPKTVVNSIVNGNDIKLSWTASTYANGYHIYQVVDGEKIFKRTVNNTTTTTFTNMPEGDYTYEVNSFSTRFGESPESSKLIFNLTWPIVQPPVVTSTVFNANNITLAWKGVPWANEYKVYKVTQEGKEQIYKGTALTYKVYNLSEDTHSFEVVASSTRFVDSVPSNKVTETIVYPVMQAPEANLTLLSDTSARVVWNFVTYANGYNLYEIIDGEKVLVAEKINNLSYTIQNLSYANHEYVVTSYSNSFGESTPSNVVLAKLIIDTTAPVTTTVENEKWVNSDQTITLQATDDETGVAKTFYSVNEGPFVEGTTITVTAEGSNKVQFYSIDKVGNKEEVKTIYSKIDKTAPTTVTNEITTAFSQSHTVTLTASDELSGVSSTFYSINGSAYQEGTSITVDQEGTNEVSYYSIDHAGNKEEAKTLSVKVDRTAPTTASNVSENWYTDDVPVTLTALDVLSGVEATYYSINGSELKKGSTFTVNQEGLNEVVFYSIDKAGNREDIQTVIVKIDKSSPVTQSTITEAWTNEDVQVTLTAEDAHSGISKTFYSINESNFQEGTSFTVSQEGISKVSYYSVDKAGNIEQAQTSNVMIDKTAPVTVSNVTEEWSKDDVQVTLTTTDEHSGSALTYYSINGSDYQEGTAFTVNQEDVNEISYFSIDHVGNWEAVRTVEVKIDKTAPELSMNVNELYELGSSVTLTYKAADKLSGMASEVMTVNDLEVENGSTLSLNKPGTYTINVTAIDKVGNQSTISKTFNVYIPATIEVTPKVIKGNKGVFTVRVDVPAEFKGKINLDSATLNGVSALNSNNGYYNQAKNGQFKFERSDFTWTPSEVLVEFEGYVDGYLVKGHTTVIVKK
ncbi:OmpL47-type beta-barrel domain-containing protein [Bacillus suaedaesalsae]|uniref:Fibronectin type-III domain-containing protein n=1 Tax=Bacillus suaedaesalsae TaxID=2810349 RepID=A0ABS2DCY1_9BACI|nr:hypothetical protein [Bacillus suaedaesalsae]MBM6616302.1 hypothetical protein [Bacillus suaedaesalsae]